MKTHVKIPRGLYCDIIEDLRRPHPVAYERVSFLIAKTAVCDGDHRMLLVDGYWPVADVDYLDDPGSSACITGNAIRYAIQQALQLRTAILHAHLHEHRGKPWFSKIDLIDNPRIIASCRAVCPNKPHGMLVFSKDHVAGLVWHPESPEPYPVTSGTVVGYPTEVMS
jgi:hypothetical protein